MFYKETQSLNSIWIKIPFITFNVGLIAFIVYQLFNAADKNIKYELIWSLTFVVIIEAAVYYLLFVSKAQTRIDNSGIHIQYFPMLIKPKTFKWVDIKDLSFINISPIKDFGGWGYRASFRKGTGVILGNGDAIQITLKNDKKFTITTKKKEEMLQAIEQWRGEAQ